ncbi:hypothetical protein ACWEQL_21220 [Kitasatospora sp. NPDC004240]
MSRRTQRNQIPSQSRRTDSPAAEGRRPHGEVTDAAVRDDAERRTALPATPEAEAPQRAGWAAWRSPHRMRGQVLVGVTGALASAAVLRMMQFLADHVQITIR